MDILQLDIVKKFEDMLKANFSLVNNKNERLFGDKMCKGNQDWNMKVNCGMFWAIMTCYRRKYI